MTNSILEKAEKYCIDNKYRFTQPRMETLLIILKNKKPLNAYEILEQLGKQIKNPKPPTVYRALEFWISQGFIHKIDSLNAYTSCEAGHLHKGAQFTICGTCGDVSEMHLCSVPQTLEAVISAKQFTPSYWNLEVHGTCANCA